MSWRLRPAWISEPSGPMCPVMMFSIWITSDGLLPPGLPACSIAWAIPFAMSRPVASGRIFSSTSITMEALLILFIQWNWFSAWSSGLVVFPLAAGAGTKAPMRAAWAAHSSVVRQARAPVSAARAGENAPASASAATRRFMAAFLSRAEGAGRSVPNLGSDYRREPL
jgi:hypothetical protein